MRSRGRPCLLKLWLMAVFAVLVLGASPVLAATPTTTTGTVPAATTSTTSSSGDEPTNGESLVAAVAILGGIFVALAVIWLVSRAHDIQAKLATASVARGGSASTVTEPAAGLESVQPDSDITISGPDEVAVDSAGEFTVAKTVTNPAWSVSGIGTFTQRLRDDDHTLVFTPHEEKTDVTLKVTDGTNSGEKHVKILAAAESSFVIRFAVRNWGLVVVAVAIVFGAIALGVTGHLDGANFVALVASLAALLGITATAGERGGGNGAAGGASAGGGDGGVDRELT